MTCKPAFTPFHTNQPAFKSIKKWRNCVAFYASISFMFHPLDGTAHRGRHLGINIGPTLDITCLKPALLSLFRPKTNSIQIRGEKTAFCCFYSSVGLVYVSTVWRYRASRPWHRHNALRMWIWTHLLGSRQSEQVYVCIELCCSQSSSAPNSSFTRIISLFSSLTHTVNGETRAPCCMRADTQSSEV